MLLLQARVDLGAVAIKGNSAFIKAPAFPDPHHQIVQCHIKDTRWWGLTQSAYFTAQPTGQLCVFMCMYD